MQCIESGTLSAEAVMAKDAWLLDQLAEQARPLIHFYTWERPCLTYGYFIDPHQFLHIERITEEGMQMARRPTGGGMIFHLTDFAFSLLIPSHHPDFSLNTLENYRWVNQQVAEVIGRLTGKSIDLFPMTVNAEIESEQEALFCMAKPTPYDLRMDGKKVGGAAQRRKRQGFLHQATLSLSPPPYSLLEKLLKSPDRILTAMKEQGGCLLSSSLNLSRSSNGPNSNSCPASFTPLEDRDRFKEELKKNLLASSCII
jgi:lipoate-protein ligase A